MLKPAYDYEERVYTLLENAQYLDNTEYLNSGQSLNIYGIHPNGLNNTYHMVSVDNNDNIIGYFTYTIKNRALKFGIAISFIKNSLVFGYDWYTLINDYTLNEEVDTISWRCFRDNPTKHAYYKICQTFHGRVQEKVNMIYYIIDTKATRKYIQKRDIEK